jgi:non-heme chloroperoxidase
MQQTVTQLRFATARLATGPRVHYAEQGDPGAETLVFVHGWPDSWFSFSRILPLLPPRYRAYALSQRGFGDSERPASGYAIDDFAADVAAFLDVVGVERASLVGHSMGSFVVRRVAQIHPDRVARLVLIGSAVTAANAVLREVQAVVRTLEDPLPPAFVREFQSSTVHVPLPEPFFEGIVAESLKAPARVWQGALDGVIAADDSGRLGRMAVPTLVLWGEQDALFSHEDQERLVAAIPGAKLMVYPDTGHSSNWERPERVAADLDAFVRGA